MDKFAKSLLHISSVCGYLGVYECVQVSVNMYNCVCGCLCVWVGVYRFIKYNILHIYSLFIYTQMCVYTYEYEPFYITMTSLPHSRNATFCNFCNCLRMSLYFSQFQNSIDCNSLHLAVMSL